MNCRFFIIILTNTSKLIEVFRVASNSTLQIIYHQHWNSRENGNRILSNYYQHRNDFQEHSLKIALINVSIEYHKLSIFDLESFFYFLKLYKMHRTILDPPVIAR